MYRQGMPFTYDDISTARKTNIVSFLETQGVTLERKGKKYSVKEHDSLIIDPISNLWFWNSRNTSGKSAIDFIMEYCNCDFTTAVGKLIGHSSSHLFAKHNFECSVNKTEKAKFKLLPSNNNFHRLYAYLVKTRGISANIVTSFVRKKVLYEDKMHNCVFVGLNEKNEPKYASVRGTLSDIQYRKEITDSDKTYGFCHKGNGDTLYIFEAAIDMMSYMTLYFNKECSYLSLGGLHDIALTHFLSINKNVKKLIFCLDGDTPGIYATHIYCKKYSDKYICSIKTCDPYKDWNEYLTMKDGDIIRNVSYRPGTDKLVVFDTQNELRNFLNNNYAVDNSLLLLPSVDKDSSLNEFLAKYEKQRGKKISNINYYGTAINAVPAFLGGKRNG